jgi:ApbE superfamily uncharacterized protein (UPF0280 family)
MISTVGAVCSPELVDGLTAIKSVGSIVSNLTPSGVITAMTYEHYIGAIDEDSILVECGPMRLVIRAWRGERPQLKLARQACKEAILYLERIARCRLLLSRPWPQIEELPDDELARRMVTSVKAIGDEDLTPMAAVAGTIADAVADWLFERNATRVLVENGGDIAIRLAEGETAAVGVRPQVNCRQISHVIRLDAGQRSWGVTTSGVGGRSLTRGIASAVTVAAANASLADAAATAIGNACFVEDEGIIQLPAESLDPHTDLAGLPVTAEVGELQPEKVLQALESARQKAALLSQRKIIRGAFMALQNVFTVSEGLQPFISSVNR